jgi:hypothetical protein
MKIAEEPYFCKLNQSNHWTPEPANTGGTKHGCVLSVLRASQGEELRMIVPTWALASLSL